MLGRWGYGSSPQPKKTIRSSPATPTTEAVTRTTRPLLAGWESRTASLILLSWCRFALSRKQAIAGWRLWRKRLLQRWAIIEWAGIVEQNRDKVREQPREVDSPPTSEVPALQRQADDKDVGQRDTEATDESSASILLQLEMLDSELSALARRTEAERRDRSRTDSPAHKRDTGEKAATSTRGRSQSSAKSASRASSSSQSPGPLGHHQQSSSSTFPCTVVAAHERSNVHPDEDVPATRPGTMTQKPDKNARAHDTASTSLVTKQAQVKSGSSDAHARSSSVDIKRILLEGAKSGEMRAYLDSSEASHLLHERSQDLTSRSMPPNTAETNIRSFHDTSTEGGDRSKLSRESLGAPDPAQNVRAAGAFALSSARKSSRTSALQGTRTTALMRRALTFEQEQESGQAQGDGVEHGRYAAWNEEVARRRNSGPIGTHSRPMAIHGSNSPREGETSTIRTQGRNSSQGPQPAKLLDEAASLSASPVHVSGSLSSGSTLLERAKHRLHVKKEALQAAKHNASISSTTQRDVSSSPVSAAHAHGDSSPDGLQSRESVLSPSSDRSLDRSRDETQDKARDKHTEAASNRSLDTTPDKPTCTSQHTSSDESPDESQSPGRLAASAVKPASNQDATSHSLEKCADQGHEPAHRRQTTMESGGLDGTPWTPASSTESDSEDLSSLEAPKSSFWERLKQVASAENLEELDSNIMSDTPARAMERQTTDAQKDAIDFGTHASLPDTGSSERNIDAGVLPRDRPKVGEKASSSTSALMESMELARKPAMFGQDGGGSSLSMDTAMHRTNLGQSAHMEGRTVSVDSPQNARDFLSSTSGNQNRRGSSTQAPKSASRNASTDTPKKSSWSWTRLFFGKSSAKHVDQPGPEAGAARSSPDMQNETAAQEKVKADVEGQTQQRPSIDIENTAVGDTARHTDATDRIDRAASSSSGRQVKNSAPASPKVESSMSRGKLEAERGADSDTPTSTVRRGKNPAPDSLSTDNSKSKSNRKADRDELEGVVHLLAASLASVQQDAELQQHETSGAAAEATDQRSSDEPASVEARSPLPSTASELPRSPRQQSIPSQTDMRAHHSSVDAEAEASSTRAQQQEPASRQLQHGTDTNEPPPPTLSGTSDTSVQHLTDDVNVEDIVHVLRESLASLVRGEVDANSTGTDVLAQASTDTDAHVQASMSPPNIGAPSQQHEIDAAPEESHDSDENGANVTAAVGDGVQTDSDTVGLAIAEADEELNARCTDVCESALSAEPAAMPVNESSPSKADTRFEQLALTYSRILENALSRSRSDLDAAGSAEVPIL
jgi:hypothetical protein